MTFTIKLNREPALAAIGLLAPAVQLLSAFFIHDAALQGSINGLAALLAGVLVAALVKSERLAPALLGLAQAVLAFALQLGFSLDAGQQSAAMAFVGVAVAAFVRTQVVAAVPPELPVSQTAAAVPVQYEGRHEA